MYGEPMSPGEYLAFCEGVEAIHTSEQAAQAATEQIGVYR